MANTKLIYTLLCTVLILFSIVMAPVAHDILDSIVEIKRQIAEAVTNWNNRSVALLYPRVDLLYPRVDLLYPRVDLLYPRVDLLLPSTVRPIFFKRSYLHCVLYALPFLMYILEMNWYLKQIKME